MSINSLNSTPLNFQNSVQNQKQRIKSQASFEQKPDEVNLKKKETIKKLKIKHTMHGSWADYIKEGKEWTPLAAGISAVSKDGKLTDARKVIVAANVQGLDFSPNSPLGKVSFDGKTREEVLDILAKWSKDINKNDPKTIATIKAIEAMPNNKYHWSNILEHIGKE